MSAGHTGRGTPEENDDPFGYLYRPEDGTAPQAPRQPSYNQVRPVGERTYGGQQGGFRQPQQPPAQPNAYYAAPEAQTQAAGAPPLGRPPAGRRPEPEPRRNGLLVGAIAVVLAVVLGVGAAIVFSGDDEGGTAGGDPTPTGGTDGPDGEEPSEEPSEDPTDEEPDPGEPPVADLAELALGNIGLASDLGGARSPDGSYIAVQGTPNSSITWTFEVEEAGTYWLRTGYAAVSDGQGMGFSVNGTPRDDGIEMKDYAPGSDEWDSSWFTTYKIVELEAGSNTVQYTCASSCDVVIDWIWLTEPDANPEPWA
jgi:hypothetical protein